MTDALDSFRLGDQPVHPRTEFALELRERLERAAESFERNDPMTATQTKTELVPYIAVSDAAAAIEFYRRAFNATERYRLTGRDGRVGHAEIDIAGCVVMLSDEYPDFDVRSPTSLGGTPVAMHLQVPDVDAFVEQAVREGAELTRPVEDQFYGNRSGAILDPFGHKWMVQTPVEYVSPEEMSRRLAAIEAEDAGE